MNRQGLVADIAARKRREATWNAQLHMVQRKMLKGDLEDIRNCAVFVLRVNFVDIFACVKFTCIVLFGLDFRFSRMFVLLHPSTENKSFHLVCTGHVHPPLGSFYFSIGYGAWHMFVVVLALAAGRFHGDWKMIFLRVLKLPFLWTLGRPQFEAIVKPGLLVV